MRVGSTPPQTTDSNSKLLFLAIEFGNTLQSVSPKFKEMGTCWTLKHSARHSEIALRRAFWLAYKSPGLHHVRNLASRDFGCFWAMISHIVDLLEAKPNIIYQTESLVNQG